MYAPETDSVFSPEPTLEPTAVAKRSTRDRRVLIAEDNREMRRLIARAMRSRGCEVLEAQNGLELMHWIDLMTAWSPTPPLVDLVITDHRMPMFSGLEGIRQLYDAGDRTPVLLITAFGDRALHREATELGVRGVFDKPLDLAALRDTALALLP